VLVAVRAEVDLRRRLVDLGRRAEEAHGWDGMDESEEELLGAGRTVTLSPSSTSMAACLYQCQDRELLAAAYKQQGWMDQRMVSVQREKLAGRPGWVGDAVNHVSSSVLLQCYLLVIVPGPFC
jgi:hypothetical protein